MKQENDFIAVANTSAGTTSFSPLAVFPSNPRVLPPRFPAFPFEHRVPRTAKRQGCARSPLPFQHRPGHDALGGGGCCRAPRPGRAPHTADQRLQQGGGGTGTSRPASAWHPPPRAGAEPRPAGHRPPLPGRAAAVPGGGARGCCWCCRRSRRRTWAACRGWAAQVRQRPRPCARRRPPRSWLGRDAHRASPWARGGRGVVAVVGGEGGRRRRRGAHGCRGLQRSRLLSFQPSASWGAWRWSCCGGARRRGPARQPPVRTGGRAGAPAASRWRRLSSAGAAGSGRDGGRSHAAAGVGEREGGGPAKDPPLAPGARRQRCGAAEAPALPRGGRRSRGSGPRARSARQPCLQWDAAVPRRSVGLGAVPAGAPAGPAFRGQNLQVAPFCSAVFVT